jgi:hypothetical protein
MSNRLNINFDSQQHTFQILKNLKLKNLMKLLNQALKKKFVMIFRNLNLRCLLKIRDKKLY